MTHTPYDGSAPLFRIGAKPLNPAAWFDVDDRLPAYLDEKVRLWNTRRDDVFAAEEGTGAAQAELLALLATHLPDTHSGIYRRDGTAIEIVPAGRGLALDSLEPPLWTAAQLVQDDLVLMRRGPEGWRLAAASLSFPSSWRLGEKFGRPLHEVHGPVPGFGAGTRNAMLIERMFDHLRPEMPMLRWNWSLYGDAALFHPAPSAERRFGDTVFLRVERQTLRRLPVSGDIVFAIRIYLDPLEVLAQQPDAARIAATLADQLMALSDAEIAYKGLTAERQHLVARLRAIDSA